MFNPSQLEAMAKKVAEIIPPGLGELPQDFEQQLKGILARGIEKMDLVSREEFDLQTAVLGKTRAKLETLEKQLADIEKRLAEDSKES